MSHTGTVQTNSPSSVNLVTAENVARFKGIPILLFSGAENAVFSPESTDLSLAVLKEADPNGSYERVVFQGRGHLDCWMSERAHTDVFPAVKAHMNKVRRSPT